MLERIKFFFQIHFKRHMVLYSITLFVFLTGVTSGAFTINAIAPNQKGGLADYINGSIASASNNMNFGIDRKAILYEGLQHYCGFSLITWFFGLSYLGIPCIILAFGIKGFLIGFTTGFLVSLYGFRGFLFALLCVIPQNIIYIPCITMVVIIALENAIEKYKRRKEAVSSQNMKREMTSYTLKILLFTCIMLVGILYEMFIAPFFLKLFSSVLS